ncbi:MAG: 30S ribosomal protein S3 [Sulfuricurvum sp. PC08-66]|nr:MAG: 30S ribosomal protein S3 [Sulfuricurvum sp. PC08-66]
MGHKVNPIGLRLGINRNWDSRWFPGFKQMPANVGEDYKIRTYLKKELYYAGVSSIIIERTAKKLRVTIVAARPGIIIGKKGSDIEKLKDSVTKLVGKDVSVNIKEEKRPQASAQLVAENVATQLERRVAFRRAMKKVIQGAQRAGAKGIKIMVAGRLGGAEMARTEWYLEGRVPLHTLRAKIDFGFAEAHTTYGIIGVKVWIFKGEVLTAGIQQEPKEEKRERNDRERAPKRAPKRENVKAD